MFAVREIMNAARCDDSSGAGALRVLALGTPHVSLELLPEAGGKILSLVDRRTRREWLWRNPVLAPSRPRYGADYGAELDSGGWDEILLSVSPTQHRMPDGSLRGIPDHGDLVGQAWDVERLGPDDAGNPACTLVARGRAFDYLLRRTVQLDACEPRVCLSYELTNLDDTPLPWFWCAHPLLAIEPGARIRVMGSPVYQVDAEPAGVRDAGPKQARWPWWQRSDARQLDLSAPFADEDRGFASKIFVPSPADGCVEVLAANGREALRFQYDAAALPWLGLWINNRGWHGAGADPYLNLGVEPASAAHDDLARVAPRELSLLAPGECRRWGLDVELRVSAFGPQVGAA